MRWFSSFPQQGFWYRYRKGFGCTACGAPILNQAKREAEEIVSSFQGSWFELPRKLLFLKRISMLIEELFFLFFFGGRGGWLLRGSVTPCQAPGQTRCNCQMRDGVWSFFGHLSFLTLFGQLGLIRLVISSSGVAGSGVISTVNAPEGRQSAESWRDPMRASIRIWSARPLLLRQNSSVMTRALQSSFAPF